MDLTALQNIPLKCRHITRVCYTQDHIIFDNDIEVHNGQKKNTKNC